MKEQMAAEVSALLEHCHEGRIEIAPDSQILYLLEHYIPQVIRQHYPKFSEVLDGFFVSSARKLDAYALELYGLAVKLDSQTKTPFYIVLILDISEREIEKVYLLFGDKRTKDLRSKTHIIETLDAPIDEIDWEYRIEEFSEGVLTRD